MSEASPESANRPSSNKDKVLKELKGVEEELRQAVEGAMKSVAEGGATEAVVDDLRGGYYAAKQAREEFEKANKS